MRVLLSSWGSRGDIEPLAALALRLRELGAEARALAPPDEEFAALFARAGVTPIALGPSTRSIAAGLKAPSPDAAFRLAAELVAARFETLPAAAEGCHRNHRDRPDAGWRAGCRGAARHPLRARDLPHLRPAVAALPAGGAAGQAVATR